MSNLLNKASIIITPTGYDTGYLLGIKPSVPFGSELVSETTDNISGWIEARSKSTLSIVDNNIRATRTDVGAETIGVSSTVFTTVVGRKYRIKVNATKNNTNGNIYVRVSNSSNVSGTYFSQQNATDAISVDINFVATATTAYVGILATSQDTGNYVQSNLMSIKEDVGADLEFSRASTATRTNALQTIENVSINVPRIDYTGGVGSILLEPQSTNLVEYSEDFSDSYWNKGVTISKSSGVSPTGELNAFKYENSGIFNKDIHRAFTLLANTNYTFTIYIKKINSNSFSSNDKIRIGAYGSGITTNTTLLGDALNSANIGEWVRYELSSTTNSTGGSVTFQLRSDEACAIDIFGAQLEQQSFPTSYIPTSGSTVTRLGETLTNSGNADLISSTEGVLYAEIAALANDSTFREISLNDGATNNAIEIRYNNNNNKIQFIVRDGGSVQVNETYSSSNVLDFHKLAFSYKANDFKIFVNGTKVFTDTSGTIPSGLNELSFNWGGTNPFYGKTKCVAVFKEALTDVQLQCLTS